MTDLVDPDDIIRIVGAERDDTVHIARAVSAERTVYILHARDCLQLHLDGQRDLRACPYSVALDNGIRRDDWDGYEDTAIAIFVEVDDDGVTTLVPVPAADPAAGAPA